MLCHKAIIISTTLLVLCANCSYIHTVIDNTSKNHLAIEEHVCTCGTWEGVPRYRAVQVFTTCTPLSLVAVVMLLVVVLVCEQS